MVRCSSVQLDAVAGAVVCLAADLAPAGREAVAAALPAFATIAALLALRARDECLGSRCGAGAGQ